MPFTEAEREREALVKLKLMKTRLESITYDLRQITHFDNVIYRKNTENSLKRFADQRAGTEEKIASVVKFFIHVCWFRNIILFIVFF